ncbi:MAG TPA: DedA family protein [Solirubrobacteraceae bacterium]|jgi:undecaprenyl-diphosphatase|nr:DedA family protein [Solirubrobacteraceae bacterium]
MRLVPLALAAALLVLTLRARGRASAALVVAGLLLAAALAVYGVGVVDPPNVEDLLLDVGDALGNWAYLLVAGLAFLETGAFVGLVAPGETAVIAGGVFAGQGNLQLAVLLLLVWAACVAGDSVSFWLGRRLGRGFLLEHGPKLKITERRLAYVEGYFERRGGLTILVGRFIGIVRAVAPFVAGASRMSFARFLPYDIAGSGLWAATFVLLGYFSWRNIDRAAAIASRGTLALGTTAAVVVALVVAHRLLRTPERRARALRWLRERRPGRHNDRR